MTRQSALALAYAMLVGSGCALDRTELTDEGPLRDGGAGLDASQLDSGITTDTGLPPQPCTTSSECPATSVGEFGNCEPEEGEPCGAAGIRSRVVTRYSCGGGGICEAHPEAETEACSRNADGFICGEVTSEPWSDCAYADHCSETGARIRSTTTPTCMSGICEPVLSFESDPSSCDRPTNGLSCGAAEFGSWGECMSSAICDTAGTQMRSVTGPICRSGSCSVETWMESEGCTLPSTDGVSCGAACGEWSPCFGSSLDSCSGSGTQTRTCVEQVCSEGSCSSSANENRESRTCILGEGSLCATSATCGPCREVADASRCRANRQGVRSCDIDTGSCSADSTCVNSGELVTVTIPCSC